jgi:hypothetical protein
MCPHDVTVPNDARDARPLGKRAERAAKNGVTAMRTKSAVFNVRRSFEGEEQLARRQRARECARSFFVAREGTR